MYTGLKTADAENMEYHAQISVYHGAVSVEILSKSYSKGLRSDLYFTIMDKSFGKSFRSHPRQKDYDNAKKWMEDRMTDLLDNTTKLVTRPSWLKDL